MHFIPIIGNNMATPPPQKRIRLNPTSGQAEVGKIVTDAQCIPFPWSDVVPEKPRMWFEHSPNRTTRLRNMCSLERWWQQLWWWAQKVLWRWERPMKSQRIYLPSVLGFQALGRAKHIGWQCESHLSLCPHPCQPFSLTITRKRAFSGTCKTMVAERYLLMKKWGHFLTWSRRGN